MPDKGKCYVNCPLFKLQPPWVLVLFVFCHVSETHQNLDSRYQPTPICLVDIVRSTHLGLENDSGEMCCLLGHHNKMPQLGLNNRNLFCCNSGVLGKDLTGPEASFHLHLATFSLYSHSCSILCIRSSPYKKHRSNWIGTYHQNFIKSQIFFY